MLHVISSPKNSVTFLLMSIMKNMFDKYIFWCYFDFIPYFFYFFFWIFRLFFSIKLYGIKWTITSFLFYVLFFREWTIFGCWRWKFLHIFQKNFLQDIFFLLILPNIFLESSNIIVHMVILQNIFCSIFQKYFLKKYHFTKFSKIFSLNFPPEQPTGAVPYFFLHLK